MVNIIFLNSDICKEILKKIQSQLEDLSKTFWTIFKIFYFNYVAAKMLLPFHTLPNKVVIDLKNLFPFMLLTHQGYL